MMLVENLESRVLLSAGSLAHSFGTGGQLVTPAGDNNQSITVLANGEFIVAGAALNSDSSTHGFLARYHANGKVDPGFGSHGRVDLSSSPFGDVVSVALAPNKDLVIIGTDGNGNDVLARLSSNGRFDKHFGTAGIAQLPAGAASPVAKVEKNQTIVVSANYSLSSDSSPVGLFLRYSKKGVEDSHFGGNGAVINDGGAGYTAGDFFILGSGQIVGLFYSQPTSVTDPTTGVMSQEVFTALEVFDKNGNLDLGFNQNQGQNIPGSNASRFLSNGTILSVGSTDTGNTTTALYTLFGQFDTLFGNGGKVTLSFPANAGNSVDRAVFEPGSKVLVIETGTTAAGAPYVALGGLTKKGKLDHTFGKTAVIQISPVQDVIAAAGDKSTVLLVESSGGSAPQEILAYKV